MGGAVRDSGYRHSLAIACMVAGATPVSTQGVAPCWTAGKIQALVRGVPGPVPFFLCLVLTEPGRVAP